MKRIAFLALPGLFTVLLAACSTAESTSPFDLESGQTRCQMSIGNDPDTATAPSWMNDYDALRGSSRGETTDSGEFWEAGARITDGVLTAVVDQSSIGTRSQNWVVADIPPTGVTLSGPWGGPYSEVEPDAAAFYFTCWSNPHEK